MNKIHWRFITGTKKRVTSFMLSSVIKKNAYSFLAASLNDLAQANKNKEIASWYQSIDYFTTDGVPLAWYARSERMYGPALFSEVYARLPCVTRNVFLGPSETTLSRLEAWAKTTNPNTRQESFVVPFHNNLKQFFAEIQKTKPNAVWIGIGSPRQAHIAKLLKPLLPHATIICVGAAFELVTEIKPMAPTWMQRAGLEWMFRLTTEPGRLWRRYLIDIPWFLISFFMRKTNVSSENFSA